MCYSGCVYENWEGECKKPRDKPYLCEGDLLDWNEEGEEDKQIMEAEDEV